VAGVAVAILAIAAPAAAGPYSNISAAMVRNAAPAVEAYRVAGRSQQR
jgi:hypothetical protein